MPRSKSKTVAWPVDPKYMEDLLLAFEDGCSSASETMNAMSLLLSLAGATDDEIVRELGLSPAQTITLRRILEQDKLEKLLGHKTKLTDQQIAMLARDRSQVIEESSPDFLRGAPKWTLYALSRDFREKSYVFGVKYGQSEDFSQIITFEKALYGEFNGAASINDVIWLRQMPYNQRVPVLFIHEEPLIDIEQVRAIKKNAMKLEPAQLRQRLKKRASANQVKAPISLNMDISDEKTSEENTSQEKTSGKNTSQEKASEEKTSQEKTISKDNQADKKGSGKKSAKKKVIRKKPSKDKSSDETQDSSSQPDEKATDSEKVANGEKAADGKKVADGEKATDSEIATNGEKATVSEKATDGEKVANGEKATNDEKATVSKKEPISKEETQPPSAPKYDFGSRIVVTEPLTGAVIVLEFKKKGFPQAIFQLFHEFYPGSDHIHFVTSKSDLHTKGTLYSIYKSDVAFPICIKTTLHTIPEACGWLNNAYIEYSYLKNLGRLEKGCTVREAGLPIVAYPSETSLNAQAKWFWTVPDARIGLSSYYRAKEEKKTKKEKEEEKAKKAAEEAKKATEEAKKATEEAKKATEEEAKKTAKEKINSKPKN
jgi:chemotaxis protein histidine kinase CheA